MHTTLLIIWHSRTGTARSLAQAAAKGAADNGEVQVQLLRADEVTVDAMLAAQGYLFAGPENLAGLSGAMKEMADSLYYPLLGRVEGRPYALIVAAGTDGEGAIRQWRRIAAGWRLRAMAEPLLVRTGADAPETILAPKQPEQAAIDAARELGAAFATGLAMRIF